MIDKIITEEVSKTLISESLGIVKEVGGRFLNNYTKRRDVGYPFCPAVRGGYIETKQYYIDTWMGNEPTEYIQTISFR